MQPALFSSNRFTVTQLTLRIRRLLENDVELQDVWVEGEISNLSRPASGHVYFTLKDKNAALRCVMWKADAMRIRLALQDGAAVEAHGKIAVYEPQGQYQLIVNIMQRGGEGELYQEFLRLKALLEAQGLFDAERKREIPRLPRVIGVVTSQSGAALRDILHTLQRRLPLARVILAPAAVQGAEAPAAIVRALASLNRKSPDVILLARGGGSIEDLWAFNDESVVRAVVDSRAPVISGVGHETDFTLCDFAADLRAPTPTAAAELATPITALDLSTSLLEVRAQLTDLISGVLADRGAFVGNQAARLKYASPRRRIEAEVQRLDEYGRRALSALRHRIRLQLVQMEGMSGRLLALNPDSVLARGYAIVTRKDGALVSRVAHARGDMRVRVSDGTFDVTKS